MSWAGRLSADLLRDLAPELEQQQIYACGPAGFVEQARELIAGRAKRFHAEAFTPPPMIAVEATGSVRVEFAPAAAASKCRVARRCTGARSAGHQPPAAAAWASATPAPAPSWTARRRISIPATTAPSAAVRYACCVTRAVSDLVLDL